MSEVGLKEKYAQLDEIIAAQKGHKGAVMIALQQGQEIFGYVPKEVQQHIALGLNVPLSEVYGVATFYSQFSLEPRGRFVVGVCMGTACYVKGSKAILDQLTQRLRIAPGTTREDLKFTLTETRCLGACGLAPVIMINDEVYGRLTPDDIGGIIDKYRGQ